MAGTISNDTELMKAAEQFVFCAVDRAIGARKVVSAEEARDLLGDSLLMFFMNATEDSWRKETNKNPAVFVPQTFERFSVMAFSELEPAKRYENIQSDIVKEIMDFRSVPHFRAAEIAWDPEFDFEAKYLPEYYELPNDRAWNREEAKKYISGLFDAEVLSFRLECTFSKDAMLTFFERAKEKDLPGL